jgi:threonine dehydrogenase-like Zn-dependent dehydrogenase
MKATVATLVAPRKVEFIEEELPRVGDDDMLIKMDAVGLCHSDMPGYVGSSIVIPSKYGYREPGPAKYPAVVGHEAVATVLETGKNVTKFKAGDKVAGRMRQCYRTHAVIPKADQLASTIMLFKLPAMKKDYLCCLAEPLECVVNIAKVASPEFGQNVAVVGCGVMGLLTVAALRHSGAKRLVAVDVIEEKLELAKKMGATDVINPKDVENMTETAYLRTEGHFFDIVVEITGSIRGLDTALQLIKYAHKDGHTINQFLGHGKILIPSVYSREETFPARLGFNLMVRTPILHSVHPCYSIDPMQNELEGIAAFMDGRLPMDEMITHRIGFDRTAEGLEWLVTPPEGYIKGIVTFA